MKILSNEKLRTGFYDFLTWLSLPLIIIDILVHTEKWERFFEETDPLYCADIENYGEENR